jgi:regulator of cell morphogenesis and NO signaling
MKMSDIISGYPAVLLLMEHFGLEFIVHDKTVEQLCASNKISVKVFTAFANLYNGFHLSGDENFSLEEVPDIITYLRNSHNYYENEKYPEIKNCIQAMYQKNNSPEIKLIEKFFNEYFEEVKEHLSYENRVVFPYVNDLLRGRTNSGNNKQDFSIHEYSEHHTDIESKLNDLKELLLKHVPVQNDSAVRRKLVVALFDLEYDLGVHSAIEETVLMPLIGRLENNFS